ncbi:3-oxoacyl-reductase [Cadophora sp. MPI-SDFR-AT-0126]|nr:3-oxoacyl-reductase [Leotiomycetes sp. MPI-SDFR-AT-0126]
MSNNLHGKVIVFSGGVSGIGLAAAKMAASRRAKVPIGDLEEDKMKEAVADIEAAGGSAIYSVVDVTDRETTEAWIEKTVSTYDPLDGAANLAGVSGKQTGGADVEDISDEDWAFCMNVNARGTMNCLRPQIKAIKDKGSIVNCASLAGIQGLEKELGPRGVRVNVICTNRSVGYSDPIKTPMMYEQPEERKASMIPKVILRRFGEADEAAELICWMLCDGSTFMTGTV